jgi:hypothetical protein
VSLGLDADADRSFSEFDVFPAVVEVIHSEVVGFYLISNDVTLHAEPRACHPRGSPLMPRRGGPF